MFSDEKHKDIDQFLNSALKVEPGYKLSDNFADLVAEKMARKFAWQQYIMEFLVYFVVVVGMAGLVVAMQFVFFDAQWQEWLQFITQNAFIVAGVSLILLFVLFTDRVLLQYFLYKSSLANE